MSYSLFLDDYRNPKDVSWIDLPTKGDWIVARNYEEFIALIQKEGLPDFITFDHDLGLESSKEFIHSQKEGRKFDYSKVKEYTGLDCAKWLVEFCSSKKLKVPSWDVHSKNPVGAENIALYLKCYERFQSEILKPL